MVKMVTWAPVLKQPALRLCAVLVPEGQPQTKDLYLSYLADSVQAMLDESLDPQQAMEDLKTFLWTSSLLGDKGAIPLKQAGVYLVESNPLVVSRLLDWRIIPLPKGSRPQEQPAARAQIEADQDHPEDRLQGWVGLLSTLPV